MEIQLKKLDHYNYYHAVIHINDYPFVIISTTDDARTSEVQIYPLIYLSLMECMQEFSNHIKQ
jgi:hypothetical protein